MGDFNTRVRELPDKKKYGLEKQNKQGTKVVKFTTHHELVIINTFFEVSKRRRYTWKIPTDNQRFLLDYILVK